MRPARLPCATALVLLTAAPASADITAFIGAATTPANRQVRGLAVGVSLLVVGFEFEYANAAEEAADGSPGLRTSMGNAYLQTPFAVLGVRPYLTAGGGVYRERLGELSETSFGMNSGGGLKISLLGPLRVRVDYRVFRLRGSPLYPTVRRTYAGLNVSF